MRGNLIYYSIVVALAGFLFGFDTIVISGADQQLQALWDSSNLFHGFVVMSMALWGTVIGAIFGHIPTDSIGRKKTLIWIGVLYLISALGSALVSDPYTFSFFRFIGGLGVGASTIAAPAFVSEIAPKERRGKLVALYQFNIVFGILVAFVSNYLWKDAGHEAWRYMIGTEALPALIYTLLVFGIPESPRWLLLKKNDLEGARKVFQIVIKDKQVDLDKVMHHIKEEADAISTDESILDKHYRFPIMLAFLVAFFNQASGINAVLYYAPRIMSEAGLEKSSAFLSSIGIGVINMIFTLLGLYLIDFLGRRVLMLLGSFGYIISLSMVAMAFFLGWQGMAVPIFLFIFIAAHALGQGTVIWVFISEIFPNHMRAKGQSFGSSTHWIMAALITIFMPPLLSSANNPGYVFVLFAFLMVLQLLFVIFVMPETKGVSLEDLQEKLQNKEKVVTENT